MVVLSRRRARFLIAVCDGSRKRRTQKTKREQRERDKFLFFSFRRYRDREKWKELKRRDTRWLGHNKEKKWQEEGKEKGKRKVESNNAIDLFRILFATVDGRVAWDESPRCPIVVLKWRVGMLGGRVTSIFILWNVLCTKCLAVSSFRWKIKSHYLSTAVSCRVVITTFIITHLPSYCIFTGLRVYVYVCGWMDVCVCV